MNSKIRKKIVIFLAIIAIVSAAVYMGYKYSYELISRAAAIKVRRDLKGNIKRDIVYKIAGGKEIKLDMYLPDDYKGKKAPVIIYVHGGYWSFGDKAQEIGLLADGVKELRRLGYAVVSINYRLTDKNIVFPAHIEDVKDSIRWIRSKSGLYQFDENNIGIMGASAGGHLALLAGLSSEGDFTGDNQLEHYSSKVKYIVSWFGPTDLRGVNGKYVPAFLGTSEEKNPDLYIKASPITYIGRNSPPILLMHGDKDEVVSIIQSEELFNAGKNVGADIQFITVKNAKHGFIQAGKEPLLPSLNEIAKITWDFILKNSK